MKTRLDVLLAEKGLASSREKAPNSDRALKGRSALSLSLSQSKPEKV